MSILITDLIVTHPDYDAEQLRNYEALYRGGKWFRALIDTFLIKRGIEKTAEGAPHYELRKQRAWYVARGAGLMDWFVASVFKNEPEIKIDGQGSDEPQPLDAQKAPPANPKSAYWLGLNEDADGLGTDLSALLQQALKNRILYQRSYLALNFESEIGQAAQAGSMDARITVLSGLEVDRWDHDASMRLLWIRRAQKLCNVDPFQALDTFTWRWTYTTADQIATYEFIGTEQEFKDKKAVAKLTAAGVQAHDFGALPVFPILGGDGLWIMDRIADILIALFNRESSISYGLDQLAYPLLTLTLSQTDLAKIWDATTGAIRLSSQGNEKAEYVGAPAEGMNSLFQDVDRLKNALYEVLNSLFVNAAATQTQNARQSAQAKVLDKGPLTTYLHSLACPVEDAMENLISALQEYRGEEALDIEIEGLDQFEAQESDLMKMAGIGPQRPNPDMPDGNKPKSGAVPDDGPTDLKTGIMTDVIHSSSLAA